MVKLEIQETIKYQPLKSKRMKITKFTQVILAVAVLFTVVAMTAKVTAPTARIGFASSGSIMRSMPETASVLAEIDSLRQQFNEEFNKKIGEYQVKSNAFKADEARLNEVVKKDRQEELQMLQTSIGKFQQAADNALKQKEQELMKPIYTKVQKVIDEVATEYSYTHILNIDSRDVPLMLYAQKTTRVDSLIIQKLKVPIKK